MSKTVSYTNQVGYRGELMVELWLQELDPVFVARPTNELPYDFFAGFRNNRGGINSVAVEVKASERPISGRFPVDRQVYTRWANSNIPVLLVVADVKQNRLYYAFPSPDEVGSATTSEKIQVRLTEIDDRTKEELRATLVA